MISNIIESRKSEFSVLWMLTFLLLTNAEGWINFNGKDFVNCYYISSTKAHCIQQKNNVRWMECYGHVMDFESTNLYRFHCIVNMWSLSWQHISRKYVFHERQQQKNKSQKKKNSIKFKQNRDTISTKLILKKHEWHSWYLFTLSQYLFFDC